MYRYQYIIDESPEISRHLCGRTSAIFTDRIEILTEKLLHTLSTSPWGILPLSSLLEALHLERLAGNLMLAEVLQEAHAGREL